MDDLTKQLLANQQSVIVAVSGGADSMALTHMLASYGLCDIHAVTVDHGLRQEAADEAVFVKETVSGFPNTQHVTLRWTGDKPDSAIQEEARFARYDLLKSYALEHKISYIFVAHHQDDQAETFLMRLAKGSGLDGLAGISSSQDMGDGVRLIRPLLHMSHDALVTYCKSHNLRWVEDPTNNNEYYLRPRLRGARQVLEKEGLSSKRLSVTAMRLNRAKQALEQIVNALFSQADVMPDHVRLPYAIWIAQPAEIRLRLLLKSFAHLRDAVYAPRMERVEALEEDMAQAQQKLRRTLGGCLIEINPKKDYILLALEPKKPNFKG